MKKITSVLLVLAISIGLLISLVSCEKDISKDKLTETYNASSRFIKTEYQDIYYDVETNIVYIIFDEDGYSRRSGYMSIYLGPNGYPCKYDINTKEIVEIKYNLN